MPFLQREPVPVTMAASPSHQRELPPRLTCKFYFLKLIILFSTGCFFFLKIYTIWSRQFAGELQAQPSKAEALDLHLAIWKCFKKLRYGKKAEAATCDVQTVQAGTPEAQPYTGKRCMLLETLTSV